MYGVFCSFRVQEKWPQTPHAMEGLVCPKCGRIVALYAKLPGWRAKTTKESAQ
jgi:hypothetical protein